LSTKAGGPVKRKKEAKKEKRVGIWKTLRVSHIPTRQTNNKLLLFTFELRQFTVRLNHHTSGANTYDRIGQKLEAVDKEPDQ
jgi:hypothetical protein